MEVSGQYNASAILSLAKISSTHWVGGCSDPRAGLDPPPFFFFFYITAYEQTVGLLLTRFQDLTQSDDSIKTEDMWSFTCARSIIRHR